MQRCKNLNRNAAHEEAALNGVLSFAPLEDAQEGVSGQTDIPLAQQTVADLKNMARELRISGYSAMNKESLVAAIGAAQEQQA